MAGSPGIIRGSRMFEGERRSPGEHKVAGAAERGPHALVIVLILGASFLLFSGPGTRRGGGQGPRGSWHFLISVAGGAALGPARERGRAAEGVGVARGTPPGEWAGLLAL